MTVVINYYKRRELQNNLMSYAFGIKDLSIIENILDPVIKGQPQTLDTPNFYVFIICYGRIFGKNQVIGKVGNGFKTHLSPDQISMHQSILDIRNQSYAHNDPIATGSVLINWNDGAGKIIATTTYTSHDFTTHINEIKDMVSKIKLYFQEELDRLIDSLYSENSPNKAFVVNRDQSINLGYYAGMFENAIEVKK